MAGLIGNQAWLAAGKQTAKGTIAPMAKHMWPFVGGNVQPTRETETLRETDSNRDRGSAYVSRSGVEGQPEIYVRDNSVDFWLAAALGTVVDSGSMPNYTHTITPANALNYFSVWRMLGGTLWESFTDVMVNELVIRAEAGSPLTAQIGLMGLKPTRLTTDPSPSWTGPPVVTLESGTVYTYNDAAVTLSGGATALVRSFELTLTNNVGVQQTDDVVPYDLTPGTREVSLAFDLIFESLTEYNQFHYGGAAGTTVSSSIYTTSAVFDFNKGANNDVQFTVANLAYEEFPVEPQPDGSPVVVSVRGTAQRGGNVLSAIVKNQKAATY